ncbi:MAG: IS21 family transposase [Gemmatimonadaceae bacterium]
MRKVLEVLRLAHEQGRSQREIASSLALSQSTVSNYLARFAASSVGWPLPPDLDEAGLEARLFARQPFPLAPARPLPDWRTVHRELTRTGVTLQLLWLEYKQHAPDPGRCYQYTQFCRYYHAWMAQLDPVLRLEHKAGERVFVDYAGATIDVIDLATGEARAAQLFVAALGASHLIYTEATWTQTLPDWIAAHVRMLEYLGGVPALIVPDNLKTGVTAASFYEPELNPTYQEFATHYQTAILPTRVARPRDKAKVESGVLIAEREILAPLRDQVFTSLAALNAAIAERREAINTRPFQKLDGTRRERFETLDRPALRPLPPTRYELAEWVSARVNIDYHIAVERHCYSVPHPLVRAKVRVRLTSTMIEVLHEGKRVAVHRRSTRRGGYTTDPAHRPKSHQAHLEWSPSRLIRWGREIGPATAAVVESILEHKPHPEQGYRACLGLFSLARRYTAPRLEAACTRALRTGAISYKSLKSILAAGLDQLPPEEPPPLQLPPAHAHVRGASYYREAEVDERSLERSRELTLPLGDH